MIALLALALSSCNATDGDTISCGDERIRLLAIDAPELTGHCAKGRNCVEGDPFASSIPLREPIEGKELTIERTGRDRYGRTLGVVYAGRVNLSCLQVETGHAADQRRYDNGGRVR